MSVRRWLVYAGIMILVLVGTFAWKSDSLAMDEFSKTSSKDNEVVYQSSEIPTFNIWMTDQGDQTTRKLSTAEEPDNLAKPISRGQEGMVISKEELDLLVRVIYAEARGEGIEGQIAVGAVVLNRLKNPEFPKTIKEVILQRGAFTAVADNQIYLTPNQIAYKAAQDALEGKDPTGGALYYYNPQTAKDRWIKSRPVIKRIGNHTFSM